MKKSILAGVYVAGIWATVLLLVYPGEWEHAGLAFLLSMVYVIGADVLCNKIPPLYIHYMIRLLESEIKSKK
jgi:hypothetical protein